MLLASQSERCGSHNSLHPLLKFRELLLGQHLFFGEANVLPCSVPAPWPGRRRLRPFPSPLQWGEKEEEQYAGSASRSYFGLCGVWLHGLFWVCSPFSHCCHAVNHSCSHPTAFSWVAQRDPAGPQWGTARTSQPLCPPTSQLLSLCSLTQLVLRKGDGSSASTSVAGDLLIWAASSQILCRGFSGEPGYLWSLFQI